MPKPLESPDNEAVASVSQRTEDQIMFTFLVNEKTDPLPRPRPRRLIGEAREEIIKHWINELLDDPDYFIATLQTMGYDVKDRKDLITMAQTMEYYHLGGYYIMAK